MADQPTAIRATVTGHVQGVFFRDTTVERARGLGVLGWVRNGDDGRTVLVHAEGPPDAIEELVAYLHEGPPRAQVEEVAVERVKVEGHEQFAVRGVPAGAFVVREPTEGRYAFGLEVDGELRWWWLRRPPSMEPADKRMAIPGVGPGDDPGPPWDEGRYEQGGRVAWPEAIERGHAVFVLHGRTLQGGFALQRTGGDRWLLVKRRER